MAKLGQAAGIQVPQMQVVAPLLNSFGQIIQPAVLAPAIPAVGGAPSTCLLICNMFDAATETEPEWDLDIREDVMEECAKHGAVEHCHIEKNKPGGMVFVKLRSVDAAAKTAAVLNGRFFAGRMITVTYLDPAMYAQMAY
jgi:RNA-binding protein 39